MSVDQLIALVFASMLTLGVGLRLWLITRHARHVAAHRHAVPAAFADAIALTAHQKAADYTLAKIKVALLEIVIDAALLVALTLGGGIDLWYQWLQSVDFSNPLGVINLGPASSAMLRDLALFGGVMLGLGILGLPFDLWRSFGIEARFGFNRMTPALFVSDLFKGMLLSILIGAPLLALVLWLMRSAGPAWWFYTWLVWVGFNLLAQVLFPTVIAPMFNKFKPLDDGSLRERIEALLQRCGFKSQGVFVVDGSRRSSHGNAYFTGLGASKRIVFYDTLLKQLSPSEVEAVLAHELGHFRLGHIRKMMAVSFVMGLAMLALLGWLMQMPAFYLGLGVRPDLMGDNTALALLLFSMALPPMLFPLQPLASAMSRKHEFEADAFASRESQPQELIRALVKLYEDNASTLTPDPLYSKFHDSHPPAAIRIAHLQHLDAQLMSQRLSPAA